MVQALEHLILGRGQLFDTGGRLGDRSFGSAHAYIRRRLVRCCLAKGRRAIGGIILVFAFLRAPCTHGSAQTGRYKDACTRWVYHTAELYLGERLILNRFARVFEADAQSVHVGFDSGHS